MTCHFTGAEDIPPNVHFPMYIDTVHKPAVDVLVS